MHAGVAHVALEHLRIFYCVAQDGVGRCLGLAQLGYSLNGIRKVHFQPIGQTVGDGLA